MIMEISRMFEQEKLKTVYMEEFPCNPEMLMKVTKAQSVQNVEERICDGNVVIEIS